MCILFTVWSIQCLIEVIIRAIMTDMTRSCFIIFLESDCPGFHLDALKSEHTVRLFNNWPVGRIISIWSFQRRRLSFPLARRWCPEKHYANSNLLDSSRKPSVIAIMSIEIPVVFENSLTKRVCPPLSHDAFSFYWTNYFPITNKWSCNMITLITLVLLMVSFC